MSIKIIAPDKETFETIDLALKDLSKDFTDKFETAKINYNDVIVLSTDIDIEKVSISGKISRVSIETSTSYTKEKDKYVEKNIYSIRIWFEKSEKLFALQFNNRRTANINIICY